MEIGSAVFNKLPDTHIMYTGSHGLAGCKIASPEIKNNLHFPIINMENGGQTKRINHINCKCKSGTAKININKQ